MAEPLVDLGNLTAFDSGYHFRSPKSDKWPSSLLLNSLLIDA